MNFVSCHFPLHRALPWFMLFHFFVDFCCGASVVSAGVRYIPPERIMLFIMLYNFLAFCTQPLTGYLCDCRKQDRFFLKVSLLTVLSGGAAVNFTPWTGAVLLGVGNSLFHVSAGRETVRSARNPRTGTHRIAPLGAFVGPGALGIGLGCLLAHETYWIALTGLALTSGIGLWCLRRIPEFPEQASAPHSHYQDNPFVELCMFLVIFCVFCRAAAGTVKAPWQHSCFWSIVLFCTVMTGKICGGWLADFCGWKKTGCALLGISGLLLCFYGNTAWGFLTGQFTANLMMAITLFLLAELYPRHPGTMFGAAAAVLFPGSLLQYLPQGTEMFPGFHGTALICFLLTVRLWNKVHPARED